MRNKGAIKLVAILLALVCVYQLSFTFVTARIEKKATSYAKGDPAKKIFYKDSLAGLPVYNFLWLKKYTYRQCQEREFNLGLDLKGGMNVMLEVSVIDLVRSLSNYSTDSTFKQALRLAKERLKSSQDDYVTLFGKAFEEIDPNAKLAAVFNTIQLRDRIKYNSTNAEVLDVLHAETKIAIDNSVKILRARIDQFGVAQPNFQEMGTAGRVMIELPGIKDHERVRKLLQVSAKLEFWETYENSEVYGFLQDANTKLKELETVAALPADTTAKTAEQTAAAAADTTKVSTLLDKLEKDTTKVADAQNMEAFRKQNPLFFLLRPNADNNGQLQSGPVVGYSHFRDTAAVNRALALPQIKSIFPSTLRLYWSAKAIDGNPEMYSLVAIKVSNREGKPALDGAMVVNARYDLGGTGNKPEVTLNMNGEGAKIWQRLTKENVGKSIAIVLDNYVRSNPTVQNEISGGRSSISGGGMTIEEAQDLANILNVGRMDAPAQITQEEIVGPSLGREAINSGLLSFILAFILVLLYMLLYYNQAGWIANVALVSNIFFIMGVLASLGAVLTLPGIAGIVLTLGMAVDANVIIYERIREELRAGKGIKLAVKEGYKHAMSAIIDGNVTTILTGIILYIFGSGPIRGFATTLVIGILTSLFSAIFISRLIFEWLLDKDKKIRFANKYTNTFLVNANLKFIEKRKYLYIFSAVLMLISMGSLTFRGLNLGVDFKGGRTFTVRFDQPVNTQALTISIAQACKGVQPQVKVFGQTNQVKIITPYMVDNQDPTTADLVDQAIFEGCKASLAPGTDLKTFLEKNRQDSQLVGPTVAKDIMRGAIFAVVFALIVIFLYILVRFRTWQFGLGAVASLFHDSVIVLGIYSLLYSIMPFSMEVDQAFIAAILTIIGYSINDTVIVFDRIREYTTLYRKRGRHELFNQAVDSTLGRTLNTAGTTLIVLVAIFIFGGPSIRGFVFALLCGIGFGTYSSIFVASAITYDLHRMRQKKLGLPENE
ncbi:MAG: protein translocase subunit SecDF [Porphyromonadaceae bacterium]|nr:MAG: protein translocase subunit SecDF [Porphyromonadaceae bacterium]